VAWFDNDTVLVMRVGVDDVTIDRIGAHGQAQPFVTAQQLGVGGIGSDTFAADAPRDRLLLKVYSGTLIKQRDRRLIWVDLRTRDVSPAMDAPLGRLDAPFAAVFSPGERTGTFRLGKDTLLASDNGSSISFEDYAIVMTDEIEKPAHIRQRFTVGY